jgi:hypothetical protein
MTSSKDMHRSCIGAQLVDQYLVGREATIKGIDNRFKVAFPKIAEQYERAFQLAKSNDNDKGRYFIGTAINYKLPVKMHNDGLDGGPAALFCCGQFKGGHLYLPDIGIKLACVSPFAPFL